MENAELEVAQRKIDQDARRAERLAQIEREVMADIKADMGNLAAWVDNESLIKNIGIWMKAYGHDDFMFGYMVNRAVRSAIQDAVRDYAERKLEREEEDTSELMSIVCTY